MSYTEYKQSWCHEDVMTFFLIVYFKTCLQLFDFSLNTWRISFLFSSLALNIDHLEMHWYRMCCVFTRIQSLWGKKKIYLSCMVFFLDQYDYYLLVSRFCLIPGIWEVIFLKSWRWCGLHNFIWLMKEKWKRSKSQCLMLHAPTTRIL
jgi:hypothetical protein